MAPRLTEAEQAVDTQLPHPYPRVKALAERITADVPDVYDKVAALESWIGSHTRYTTDIPPLAGGQDTVTEFLFGNRRGYCEQISTALAVMLRSLGIPAREATGYVPGSFNPITDLYDIEAKDAHAWVQVWFPGYGWQSFDPTALVPAANPTPAGALGHDLSAGLRRIPLYPAVALVGVASLTLLWFRRRRAAPSTWTGRITNELLRAAKREGIPLSDHEPLTSVASELDRRRAGHDPPPMPARSLAWQAERAAYGLAEPTASEQRALTAAAVKLRRGPVVEDGHAHNPTGVGSISLPSELERLVPPRTGGQQRTVRHELARPTHGHGRGEAPRSAIEGHKPLVGERPIDDLHVVVGIGMAEQLDLSPYWSDQKYGTGSKSGALVRPTSNAPPRPLLRRPPVPMLDADQALAPSWRHSQRATSPAATTPSAANSAWSHTTPLSKANPDPVSHSTFGSTPMPTTTASASSVVPSLSSTRAAGLRRRNPECPSQHWRPAQDHPGAGPQLDAVARVHGPTCPADQLTERQGQGRGCCFDHGHRASQGLTGRRHLGPDETRTHDHNPGGGAPIQRGA